MIYKKKYVEYIIEHENVVESNLDFFFQKKKNSENANLEFVFITSWQIFNCNTLKIVTLKWFSITEI